MGPLKKGPVHIAESMRMFIVWEEEEWKQIGTLLNGHGVKGSVPLVFGLKAMGSTGVHVAQLGAQSGAHASRPVSLQSAILRLDCRSSWAACLP